MLCVVSAMPVAHFALLLPLSACLPAEPRAAAQAGA